MLRDVSRQSCYIPGTSDSYSGIEAAINTFDDDISRNKRIVLFTGCVDQSINDPCSLRNTGNVEYTIINTIGNSQSTIMDPFNHLYCLAMDEKRLFVVDKFEDKSWRKVINNFKATMCNIERTTASPSIEPTTSPTNHPNTLLPSIPPTAKCELSVDKRPCTCFEERQECEQRMNCIYDGNECVIKRTEPTKRPTRKVKTSRPTSRRKII